MQYDIGIIGAGLVGSLAALCLAQQGHHVALIDPNRPSKIGKDLDLRVSAITPFSWNLLQQAGVTVNLDPTRYSKILAMEIFEEQDQPLHFYASEVGRDQLGIIIENSILLQAIQKAFPATITRIYETVDSINTLQNQHPCKLYLLAQGGQTNLTAEFGVAYELFDYQEEALVFYIESERPHGHTAYQRFFPKPIAFLPSMQDNVSSIVWTLSTHNAKIYKASPELLLQHLQAAFPNLGNLKIKSDIAAFPMMAQNALQVTGNNWILMGDAAHIVHPLAGQGVNLGFRDVAALSRILTQYSDLTDPALMDAYRQSTLRHNRLMSRGFSLIHYFYEAPVLSPIRHLGTKILNKCTPLKRELIKLAIGERFQP